VLLSEDPWEDLKAYTETYLKEEIEQEEAVRNLGQFVHFLKVAALQSGELLNYASVGSDAAVPETTVRAYFDILKDTLIGTPLEPWRESKKRKAIRTVKFYLFDPGVRASLLDQKELVSDCPQFGSALEHGVLHELRAARGIRRTHWPLHYWRSTAGHEVDFCLGGKTAIEVKATFRLSEKHFRGLKALKEERVFKRYIMATWMPRPAVGREESSADPRSISFSRLQTESATEARRYRFLACDCFSFYLLKTRSQGLHLW
jgi:predicted AAA+ superfamily ATPase